MPNGSHNHRYEAVPCHELVVGEALIDLRNEEEVDEGDRVVHILRGVVCHLIVLADRTVDLSNEQERDQDYEVEDTRQEDAFVAIDLTLAVFLLSVGLRDKGSNGLVEV